MHLRLQKPHLSIQGLEASPLPKFTLVTGVNGVGKTHLLQGISEGSIIVSNEENGDRLARGSRYLDWNGLVPTELGPFSSETIQAEVATIRRNYEAQVERQEVTGPILEFIEAHSLPEKYTSNPKYLASLSDASLRKLTPLGMKRDEFLEAAKGAIKRSVAGLRKSLDPTTIKGLESSARAAGKHILLLDQSDMSGSELPVWGGVDLFQQSFSRLFVAYRDAFFANELKAFRKFKGQRVKPLSKGEFKKIYGPPPWEFVNRVIADAGLGFRINSPDLYEMIPYIPVLRSTRKGISIPFSALSSGEKVLMSFAFCVYYGADQRQLTNYPEVLLLDEIDAPLHPSMTRSLIGVIQGTLVDTFGINVILATHSPSTVALAPEDSVFELVAGRKHMLRKISKSRGLDILTTGVPTLSISFDGRRHVFVESQNDAAIYDVVYRSIKQTIDSERSLQFVAVGIRSDSGADTHTGCHAVKRIVKELNRDVSHPIYGLVDWDGHNHSSSRIAVLGEGERDGIENFILDPLLIAAFVLRVNASEASRLGFTHGSYYEFLGSDRKSAQLAVKKISTAVFPSSKETVEVEYINEWRLNIPKEFLTTDDHKLEELILERLPFLRAVTKQRAGALTREVANSVILDKPEFVPSAFKTTFEKLLG